MQRTALRLFGGLAKTYDSVVDLATLYQDRRWKRWVTERLDRAAGEVLDVGCGTLLLEERFAGSGRVFVGVDLSADMVRAGHAKRLPNVILELNGDAEALPFPDGRFRTVVSCYVPKYVDMGRFTSEIARVSKPQAQVLLYDFARPRGILAPFLEVYIQGCLRIVGFLLGLAGRGPAFAFDRLPGIVEGATWDDAIVGAMEGKGFETVSAERLTGGVVFAYHGRRGGRP